MNHANCRGIVCAILAAAFYALNAPLSKLLLSEVSPTIMAALLYLGAGLGTAIVQSIEQKTGVTTREQRLTHRELPYTIGMVLLDIAAPIALMMGLNRSSAANASLLNNFEIVATALIALLIFKERISPKLWVGIALVTLSSMLLSIQDAESFTFSAGSIFVMIACVCWGFENNCTRMLSSKNPVQIVIIKGIGSGLGSFVIALWIGESLPSLAATLMTLLLGFVAYGLSIVFYIYAQRELGAAKTSAYYAIAPFIGVALSLLIFREFPDPTFLAALLIMIGGTWIVTTAENQ